MSDDLYGMAGRRRMSDIKLNDSYYLLLQGLADGIIITDPEGYITFVNHSAEQIRNIKAEDMIGQHILKCHKDSSREKSCVP